MKNKYSKRILKAVSFSVLVSVGVPAWAVPLTAMGVLQQFNLVVLQNAASNSHVDGRTYIGGAVNGGEYAGHSNAMSASAYAGLTTGGSASNVKVNNNGAVIGGSISNFTVNSGASAVMGAAANGNFNGAAYVGGASANVNFNGGHPASMTTGMQTAATAATSTNFGQVMDALSLQLSQYASTGSTVTMNGNKAIFNAQADANGLAVFDLTLIDTQLFGLGEFEFNLGTATTILFNTDNTAYDFSTNFLGGSAALLGTKAIWNFYNAETLKINNQFGGVILATDAALTNNQNIEGSVIVESLNQNGEIHYQNFTGTLTQPPPPSNRVPEPSALLLFGLALAVLAGCLRYRK